MQLEKEYERIQLEVLERVKPKQQERDKLTKKYQEIVQKLQKILPEANIDARIELTGSFSRDTWLSGNRDLDIFVIMPYESKKTLEDVIKIVKAGINYNWIKKHANHPYLYAVTDGIAIEILPCYEFTQEKNIRSAVDRSPSHSKFVNKHLPVGANDDVRLMKQFMHGIGVYGAEIKVHGFSGYLVELLIIHYGGKFIEMLKQADELPHKVITFFDQSQPLKKKFDDDLVLVIDPIDSERNVASALKDSSLYTFIAAAKKYLNEPSIEFFFPKPLPVNSKMKSTIENHPLYYAAIFYDEPQIADDILWGQIRKFEKSIRTYLTLVGMEPIFIDSLISQDEIMTIVVSTEQKIPSKKWLVGPPVVHKNNEDFLEKYQNNPDVLFGPAIIGEKWQVLLAQSEVSLVDLISIGLKKDAISQPSYLNLKEATIVSREDLLPKIEKDEEKLRFLYTMLQGKPHYL